MAYKIAIQRSGHWFAFPPELEDEMRRILQRDIALLAFMIAAGRWLRRWNTNAITSNRSIP